MLESPANIKFALTDSPDVEVDRDTGEALRAEICRRLQAIDSRYNQADSLA